MKVGDLVRVKSTSTSDGPTVVELYHSGDPCLVTEIAEPMKPLSGIPVRGPWVKLVTIDGGKELTLRFGRLEVIET